MIYAAASASFEATVNGFATGLVGTIGARIVDGQGNTNVSRSTAAIVESPAGSGIYTATLTTPASTGQYSVVWDDGTDYASEDLTVTAITQVAVSSGTFTYDVTTTLGKVRLEIGDTDENNVLFTDAEINVYLTNNASAILLTAADLCDVLATRFSREYDFETDDQKFQRMARVDAYRARAKELRTRSAGISVTTQTKVDAYSDDLSGRDLTTSRGRASTRYYDPDRSW